MHAARFLMVMGLALLGLSLHATQPDSASPLTAKVLRQNVNLRAKPSMSAEVVVQVSEPEELTVKRLDGEWVEIVPPPRTDLWVLGDYVQDGAIQCERRVNVRAGAGINFNVVGQLSNGDPVEVRGTHADWVKIAPPDAASLWIATSMVQIVQPAPEPAPEPAQPAMAPAALPEPIIPATATVAAAPDAGPALTAPTPTAPAVPEPPAGETPALEEEIEPMPVAAAVPPAPAVAAPPAGLELTPAMPQGQWRQYEGILRPRSFLFGAPSRYRLTAERDGAAVTICHVRGNEAQLRALLNRRMVVSGREYWVQRQSHPVLVPERIVLK